MKREIKFRAWDGKGLMYSDGNFDSLASFFGYYHEEFYFDENSISRDIQITQFTGLLDKNGKDIYEGDIVKCNTTGKIKWPHQGPVEYVQSYFAINCGKNLDDEFEYTHFWNNENFEILGNIYENAGLVK